MEAGRLSGQASAALFSLGGCFLRRGLLGGGLLFSGGSGFGFRSSLLRGRLLRLGGLFPGSRRFLGLFSSGLLGRGLLGLFGVIVVMAAIRSVDMRFQIAVVGLDRGFQFLAADRAVGDFGLFKEEVDHLVLIEGRAKLCGSHRVLTDILHETLAVLRTILLRGDRKSTRLN